MSGPPSWKGRPAPPACSPPARWAATVTGTAPGCSRVVAVAERAPVLELPDTHGTPVRLGGRRDRPQLVVFLPFAFSRVCGGELADLVRRPVDRKSAVSGKSGGRGERRSTTMTWTRRTGMARGR